MPLAIPIALPQLWLFYGLALCFFALVVSAARRRRSRKEIGVRRDTGARTGIIVQTLGICAVAVGPLRLKVGSYSTGAIAAYAAILLLMGGAVALFASSSATLGRNWSIEARTLDDHELVRTGSYARVRHPIYLAMLLLLLGMAVAMGHWLQLVVALPVFFAGTKMRTDAEERLLEQSFGDKFRDYRDCTPAIIPRIV